MFRASINLNLTRCYSFDAVNGRVFEVLASGGFLISNRRAELFELFEEGRDLVCFDDEDDLARKVRYFLDHPGERQAIAEQGRKTVLEKHTMGRRIDFIIDSMGLEL